MCSKSPPIFEFRRERNLEHITVYLPAHASDKSKGERVQALTVEVVASREAPGNGLRRCGEGTHVPRFMVQNVLLSMSISHEKVSPIHPGCAI